MEVELFLCVCIELGRTVLGIVTKIQCRSGPTWVGDEELSELDSDGSTSRIE